METIDTQNTPDNGEEINYGTNAATYCPEDNCIRLYVGRVPRDEYMTLKAEGWRATPKQSCDFVATWNVARRDRALAYAGFIGDEDQDPADRAADRAERFAGYRDKRTAEATGHADSYDSQPIAHGFQSEKKAERSAARHDRLGDKATDQWSKAEYWKQRTDGVISHALHRSAPDVRMGRIKTLEADLRKLDADHEKYTERYAKLKGWAENPAEIVEYIAKRFYEGDTARAEESVCDEVHGYGKHRNPCDPSAPAAYRSEHLKSEHPPTLADYLAHFFKTHHHPDEQPRPNSDHLKLRLAYEWQMLEAQGGRAAMIEMEVGGWIGEYQIRKINRSAATKRVVSVQVMAMTRGWHLGQRTEAKPTLCVLNIERLRMEEYRAPSDEDKAALLATKKAEKAAAPAKDACPLINPTDEDAERLQAIWNEEGAAERERSFKRLGYYSEDLKPGKVARITQARYSETSGGNYATTGTRGIRRSGIRESKSNMWSDKESRIAKEYGKPVCKLRIASSSGWFAPPRVIIITDKPQKPLPTSVWDARTPEVQELITT